MVESIEVFLLEESATDLDGKLMLRGWYLTLHNNNGSSVTGGPFKTKEAAMNAQIIMARRHD